MSSICTHVFESPMLEKRYDPPADPHSILKLINSIPAEQIDSTTKVILKDCPNSYTFSKALAEDLMIEASNELPVLVVRATGIYGAFAEPLEGWVDNLEGPQAYGCAIGRGVVRYSLAEPKNKIDMMPVDMVANVLFVNTWNFIDLE